MSFGHDVSIDMSCAYRQTAHTCVRAAQNTTHGYSNTKHFLWIPQKIEECVPKAQFLDINHTFDNYIPQFPGSGHHTICVRMYTVLCMTQCCRKSCSSRLQRFRDSDSTADSVPRLHIHTYSYSYSTLMTNYEQNLIIC